MAEKSFNKNVDWYQSEFNRFEQKLNGQSKTQLHDLRKKAISIFAETGFPTSHNEEWKYTNVQPIAETVFTPVYEYEKGLLNKDSLEKFAFSGFDCHKLVFVNGHFAEDLSDSIEISEKFKVINLSKAAISDEKGIKRLLSENTEISMDAFEALNMAFMQDGAFIYFGEDFVASKPIVLLFISAGKNEEKLIQARNLIYAEKNSKATIIEAYQSQKAKNYFLNAVTDVILNENANIEHVKIQNETDSAFHFSSLNTSQETGSRLNSFNLNLGGKLVRSNISCALNGEGCDCTLNGIYIGNQTQHIDNHTVIEHKKPHCTSSELYKGIMNDQARGIFNGKIHVYPDAQKTNSMQSNSGLLLSETASIDTKPQLEIYADDVRCTHGATIGQLDDNALFYLQSRGIGVDKAKEMLITAFAGEVVEKLESDSLRNTITEMINIKMQLDSNSI